MNEEKDPPTCASCRHYSGERAHCYHPQVMKFDPVHGRESQWVRHLRPNGACGYEGTLWEAWPPTPKPVKVARWLAIACLIGAVIAWPYVR